MRNFNGLSIAKSHAESKGGQCLSESYNNNHEKLLWTCDKHNHETWTASFNSVVRKGSWCPKCKGDKTKIDKALANGLQIAQCLAISKGGECLTDHYKNAHQIMAWKCKDINHPSWNAKFNNIVHNSNWCPLCGKKSVGEQRTRQIFEIFFKLPFPTTRPTWNINPWTGKLLELDGYCKEFNIAFEYDGEHHNGNKRYQASMSPKKDLTYQKFKDHQKKKNCQANGILLVNIPIPTRGIRNHFEKFLFHVISCCNQYGIQMKFSENEKLKMKDIFNKH